MKHPEKILRWSTREELEDNSKELLHVNDECGVNVDPSKLLKFIDKPERVDASCRRDRSKLQPVDKPRTSKNIDKPDTS